MSIQLICCPKKAFSMSQWIKRSNKKVSRKWHERFQGSGKHKLQISKTSYLLQRPLQPTFPANILNLDDKHTLENTILSENQLTDKCLPHFMICLHFPEICIDRKLAGL